MLARLDAAAKRAWETAVSWNDGVEEGRKFVHISHGQGRLLVLCSKARLVERARALRTMPHHVLSDDHSCICQKAKSVRCARRRPSCVVDVNPTVSDSDLTCAPRLSLHLQHHLPLRILLKARLVQSDNGRPL